MHHLLDPAGIVSSKKINPQKPEHVSFPGEISQVITAGLKETGINKLYSHQGEAIQYILQGLNVIASSSTASGKSIIYTIPVLNSYLENPGTTALYLTPAKALGQDQRKTINVVIDNINWPVKSPAVNVCDGDTPFNRRSEIMQNSNILITTIDLLHYSLLPHHTRWNGFFSNLKYVIVDEAHIYRGILGTNVCHVLRRLRRICSHYGKNPVFILCTATIGNPEEFAEKLTGTEFKVINRDTSPSGEKQFIFYAPPAYTRSDGETARRLTHYEAARALGRCVENGHRVITFGRSRRVIESMYRKLGDDFPHLKNLVTPYKGTYTPEVRRKTEKKLFNGELKGVMTTSALELGIDVGNLDICILAGFPGSIASTWQQAGRVGRKGQKSMIVLIAGEDPLDLYLISNPDYFFGQSFEKAVVNPDKIQFMIEHLLQASIELPLVKEDNYYWGKRNYYRAVKFLKDKGYLKTIQTNPVCYKSSNQLKKFSLRGDSDEYEAVTKDGRVLEKYDYPGILNNAFPGSILFIMGRAFLSKQLNRDQKQIILEPLPSQLSGHSTRALLETKIIRKKADRESNSEGIHAFAGVLEVTSKLKGYYLITPGGNKNTCELPQHIEPYTLKTTGIWFNINTDYGSMHALEHLLHIVVPWFVMCERNDISTHIDSENRIIYVYDNYEGGVGLSESVLLNLGNVLEKCFEIVKNCRCLNSCPACLVIPQCPSRNENLNKEGVLELLEGILGSSSSSFKNSKNKKRADLRLSARALER